MKITTTRKINCLALLGILLFLSSVVFGQTTTSFEKATPAVKEQCLSTDRHHHLMEVDPQYKAFREAEEARLLEYSKHSHAQEKAIKTIPCVVHVIHLAGQAISTTAAPTPNISDAQIQSAIDYMTKAFRGQAPYSGVDTQIEFCLAKRDPSGNPSTGIVRVSGSGVAGYATLGCNTDTGLGADNEVAVKALSKWDNTKYYNIWIVTEIDGNNGGAGTQGFAYFPGAGATYDGAIMLYNAFGYDINGTLGYNLKSYTNLNITPIHEIGHGLNLYHTFEGDGGGGSCPSVTNGCGSGVGDCCTDTPPHKRSNSNCVVATNSCTGGSSALHIYNFMDYSSDVCQTQFTSDQNTARMAPTLTSGGSRYSLTQSNGCNPVFVNDAAVSAVVAPNGSYCKTIFDPIVTLTNSGSATLTSATITYDIDGGTSQVFSWTGSLSSNTSVDVTLNSMTTTAGAHTFNAASSLPNGVTDEYLSNDAQSVAFNIAVNAIPFIENFEGAFVPTGWTRNSADVADGSGWGAPGVKQWEKRSASGNGVSTASAAMNYAQYNQNLASLDEMVSPAIDLNGTSAPQLSFNVAHAYYGPSNQERLRVLISTDCGVTFTSIYDKSYSALATVGQMGADFTPSSAAHWRLETVDLAAYAGNSIVLKFEGTNGYGNNLFLDDITVNEPCNPPVVSVQPANNSICTGANATFSTTATGVATLTYQWQVSTNGGTTWSNVANGGVYSNATTNALTITGATAGMNSYQYNCVITNGCGTVTSNASTLTLTTTTAPTGMASQTYCDPATVADLLASGSTIQWYAASSGGTALPASTSLVDATNYYATQTVNGCESSSRFTVTATINTAATPTGSAAQSFCDPATVGDLTAAGTSIQWYNGSSGGTPLVPATALVDGNNYYASQTVGACESGTRLTVAVTVNTTLAPTGSADQTFCGAETVADLVVSGSSILWYSVGTGGAPLATSSTLVTGNYYASQTISGCEGTSRLMVSVTAGGAATPTGDNNQSFCNAGTIADLVAGGTAIQWYAASSGGTALPSSDPIVDGVTYYGTQTVSGCESPIRLDVLAAINTTPTNAPTGAAAQSFCSASTIADLTATGTDLLWYSASTGGAAFPSSDPLIDGVTYYATQTVSGCESLTRFGVTATVGTPASPPTGASSQSYCNSATVVDLNATGSSVQWYAASSGGTALPTSDPLADGVSYFATQTVGACESPTRFEVVVTINTSSVPTGSSPQNFCTASAISDLVASGSSLQWYAASSGGTSMAASDPLVDGASYFATQTVNGCESSTRLEVAVTIGATAAPTGNASQTFCSASTVGDLAASGASLQWYATSSGGSPLAVGTALVNGTSYYATQTVSGCESATRLDVSVTISSAATPTGSASQSFCGASTVGDLVASGSSIQWFSVSTGGSALTTGMALVNGSTYYASQTVSGCSSDTRLEVTVSIINASAPSGSGVQSLCPNSTVASLVASGSALQWYASSTGGSPLGSGTLLVDGSAYYATQTVSGCESTARLMVTVTIGTAPNAPTGQANQTYCETGTVADLVASGTAVQWYLVASGGVPLPASTLLSNGSNYYASQTIGCESDTRLVVAVTINPNPVVTLSALPTVCNTDAAFTLSQGAPVGGTYSGSGVNSPTSTFDPFSAGAGNITINYSYTNVNSCTGNATGSIVVNDCASLTEYEVSGYTVYPNPASDFVTIISGNQAIKSVQLFDNTGRRVEFNVFSNAKFECQLDVSNFAEGIYLLQINAGEEIIKSKIIVKK